MLRRRKKTDPVVAGAAFAHLHHTVADHITEYQQLTATSIAQAKTETGLQHYGQAQQELVTAADEFARAVTLGEDVLHRYPDSAPDAALVPFQAATARASGHLQLAYAHMQLGEICEGRF